MTLSAIKGTASPPAAEVRLQTRVAVLDAAERLFAARGIEGASVRDITAAAGANLGAINYHFGSKDRLVMEVFARRLEPVNRARIARLDELERAAGGQPVELSRIIEAFVRPGVDSQSCGGGSGGSFMQLLCRSFAEPHPELKRFVEEQFAEVAKRFDDAILRAVPGLSQEELFWRMSFLIGAMHHSQGIWLHFEEFPRPGDNVKASRLDHEEYIRTITTCMTAAMGVPGIPRRPSAL